MPDAQKRAKVSKKGHADARMRFMQLCLQEQLVKPTDTQALVYDNRLDQIPPAAAAVSKLAASQSEMKRWWREFLCAKYDFLAQLMEDPSVSDSAVANQAHRTERGWRKIYAQWREQADAERLVYQLRVSQGPSAESVAQTWYPDVAEFHRWAKLCQTSFAAALSLADEPSPRYVAHRVTGQTQGPSFPAEQWASRLEARAITHVAARLRAGLEVPESPDDETLEWITYQASRISAADDGDAGQLIRLPVYRAIVRIAKDFVAITRNPTHDADAHIESLIKIVKDEFKCKECDFLSAYDDGAGLSFTASTATVDPKERQELQSEQYGFGHGITGSLLLATPDHENAWVGTNNLDEDERQSPGHRHAFEGPYGKVDNFWVFPIWHRGNLLGGFRVITRLAENGEARVTAGWPLYVRLQLSALAGFVSELWEYLGEGPAGRISRHATSLNATREALIDKLGIEEVVPAFLESIIEHIEAVNLMRIEKRHVGVCLGIVTDKQALADLREYAALDGNELRREAPDPALSGGEEVLRWCSRLYNKVAPTYGTFVFDAEGHLLGVYDLRHGNGKAGLDAINSLSEPDGVTVFLLQRNSSSAGIYREGKKLAEYLLYERLGEWRLRIYDDLRRNLENVAPTQKKIVDKLVDAILHLSYHRVGALVIVGSDLVSRLDASGFRIDAGLSSMGADAFENWAKEDGAVLVSERGMVEMGGCILNVAEDLLKVDVRRQLERDQKGGRHHAAARASAACPEALVLAVSENRGITAFRAGDIVLKDA